MEKVISINEAKAIIKNLCNDFAIDAIKIKQVPANKEFYGTYSSADGSIQAEIELAGDINVSTAVHEFCHHLQENRKQGSTGSNSRAHNLNFFRLCFEVKDWMKSAYGINAGDVCGIDNRSSQKAASEYINKLRGIK